MKKNAFLLVSSLIVLSSCSTAEPVGNKINMRPDISTYLTKINFKDKIESNIKSLKELKTKYATVTSLLDKAEKETTQENIDAATTAINDLPIENDLFNKRLESLLNTLKTNKTNQDVQQTSELTYPTTNDMPDGWYGTPEDWELAKSQGWTKEDYEQQVRASENESGPQSTPEYDNSVDESPSDWVQDQHEWAKENGYENEDGSPTEKGQEAIDEVEQNANTNE